MEFTISDAMVKVMQECKPEGLQALLDSAKAFTGTKERAEHSSMFTSISHSHAENPWAWASTHNADHFLLAHGHLKDLVGTMEQSCMELGLVAGEMGKRGLNNHAFPPFTCPPCNNPVDADAQGFPSRTGKDTWVQMHELVHRAEMVMSLVRSLLVWPDDALEKGKEALADSLAQEPPAGVAVADWIMALHVEGRHFPPLLTLVNVADTVAQYVPKAAHMAIGLMSLIVARRPAASMSILDPDQLAKTFHAYLGLVSRDVIGPGPLNHVRLHFGAAHLLDALPLAYHLADWGEARVGIESNRTVAGLASMALNLLHLVERPGGKTDGPPDLAKHPELQQCRVWTRGVYGGAAGGEAALAALGNGPWAFTAVACLEVLAQWQRRGVDVRGVVVPLEDGDRTVAAAVGEYVADFAAVGERVPCLAHAGPLARGLEGGDLPEGGGLLGASLHASAARCSLPSCRATSAAGGGPLKVCSGGCQGLAQFCGKEHQLEYWPVHKKFCGKQKRLRAAVGGGEPQG